MANIKRKYHLIDNRDINFGNTTSIALKIIQFFSLSQATDPAAILNTHLTASIGEQPE